MTHHRNLTTTGAATLDAIKAIPEWLLMKVTGKTASHFYKIANPETKLGLHLDDAAAMDAALRSEGLPPTFGPLFKRRVESALAGLDGNSKPVKGNHSDGVFALLREFAEYGTAVQEAEADGEYSEAELERMYSELGDIVVVAKKEHDRIWRRMDAIRKCADLDKKRNEAAAE